MNFKLSAYSNIHARQKVPASVHFLGPGIAAALMAVLLLSCAGQVAPSGGPPDTQPPEIIHTFPAQGQTHVKTHEITLEFSEYVERRSVEQSVFLSPYVGTLKFDWGGTEVRVTFADTLRDNTTYVVTVGTDVVDVRAQNRMASSYVLAFSTGDSIDRGSISGRVYEEQAEGIMIFAYPLADINPDTLSPSRERPRYIMQTGRGGTFSFSNVALGAYRLFAVKDEYRNLLYDRDIDQYGVLPGDVVLTPTQPAVAELAFRLAREDTVKPFLSSVTAVHRSFVEFRMSEPLDSNALVRGSLLIVDTAARKTRDLTLAYISRRDPSVGGIILSQPLDSGGVYRLTISAVQDRAGNPIDSAHASVVFVANSGVDTTRPVVTFTGLNDSTRGYAGDRPIELISTKPLQMGRALSAVIVRDSVGRSVAYQQDIRSPVEGRLIFKQPLTSKAWYTLLLPLDSVVCYSGPVIRDSVLRVRFETLDLRSTGSIEGAIQDRQTSARGPVYVAARSVNQSSTEVRELRLDQPGPFKFDRLPEGQYALSAFRDSDSSGAFTPGLPYPYKPSERFVIGRDTVKVRARWGMEGVALELK